MINDWHLPLREGLTGELYTAGSRHRSQPVVSSWSSHRSRSPGGTTGRQRIPAVIFYWDSHISYWLLAISYWLSAIGYHISAISYQLSAIRYFYHDDGDEGCQSSRERKTEGSKERDEIRRGWPPLLLHQLVLIAVVVTKVLIGSVVTKHQQSWQVEITIVTMSISCHNVTQSYTYVVISHRISNISHMSDDLVNIYNKNYPYFW